METTSNQISEPAAPDEGAALTITERKTPIWQHLLAIVLAILFAWLGYFFYIQNNDFPHWYHPDEFKKGTFIMQDDAQIRSFGHPALLLETGNLVRKWMGVNNDHQEAIRCGRYGSALLAAIGVFGFTLTGYRMQGFGGLILAGLATALCPPLLVHAHYFKEDTALIAGIGICTLGAVLVAGGSKKRISQILSAALLGVGCAMAASGKYVGAVMLLPSLVAILIARNGRGWHLPIRLAVFALFTILFTLLINIRAFELENGSWKLAPMVTENIRYEIDHGTQGHYSIALNTPNTFSLRIAISDLMPHVWILGAIGLLWVIVRLKISRPGIVVATILLSWIALLSFNAIPIPRYGLPISMLIFFCASQLAGSAAFDWKNSYKWVGITAFTIFALTILTAQLARCRNFDHQFADDSRQALRNWVAGHIPAGTPVPADSYAGLQEPGDPIRHPNDPSIDQVQIMGSMFAADMASTPEELANMGIEYVIVAWPGYMRFLDYEVHGWGGTGAEMNFNRRQKFYKELFAKGEIVYQRKPEPPTHSYVNPEVTVYNIKKLATQPIRPRPSPQEQQRTPLILRMFGL